MLSKTKVKYIQSLGHKKVRDELGMFIAEGPKVVEELLRSDKFSCHMVCGMGNYLKDLAANTSGAEVIELEAHELEKISQLNTPNSVVAIFSKAEVPELTISNKISILLDGIRDPGNMGTIIRTAHWYGVENIICSRDSVDCYNPKVVQATMGSLGAVHVSYDDLSEMIALHPSISVYAATLSGVSVFSTGRIKEGFLIIGNEGAGIRTELMGKASQQISIPSVGKADSLNAAVACGILLAILIGGE